VANRPRYVDTRNPSLAVDCPRCGLRTARFLEFCGNCGYSLWPSGPVASAAFRAWQEADPERRSRARRYDMEPPVEFAEPVVDYEARAHELGIHVFPSSNYPFVICLGLGIAAFAAIPLSTVARIAFAVVGGLIFLYGIVGWVFLEDTRYFPAETTETHGGGPH